MKTVASLLYAVSATVLAAIALAFLGGGLSPALAWGSIAVGAVVGGYGFWGGPREPWRWPRLTGWAWGAALLFALFALRAFLWLVFWAGDEIQVLSPNNLGDLSLHLTYIREMAQGEPFWPQNPIYAGAPLTYPIGVDLLHSLCVLCGADLYRTFIWLGLAGSLLTGVMLWRWGGAFTLTGFLCNGGLAGVALLFTEKLADYQSTLAWKSIPLALFVTQRGFLFALPAGLLLLCSWRARFFPREEEDAQPPVVLPWWGELLLYASLPVFHFHTFLFLSLLLAAWFCFVAPSRRSVGRLIGTALLPATILVLLITASFHGPKVIGWHPGWMQNDHEYLAWLGEHLGSPAELASTTPPWWSGNQASPWEPMAPIAWPIFWVLNFGVLPFFVGVLLYRLARDREALGGRALVYPACAIFLICCLVKFAPWEWDNTKIMIWSYLVVLPPIWSRLIRPWPISVRAIAAVALFGSGFVCLLGGLDDGTHGAPIARRSELDALERDLRALPPHQRFVARPNYNHPLLLLGQKVTMGYQGHVWSHGYPWREREQTVTSIMNGEGGWREEAAALGARYLFWGAQEREAYPDSLQPWKTKARLVTEGDWGRIYDLQSPPED